MQTDFLRTTYSIFTSPWLGLDVRRRSGDCALQPGRSHLPLLQPVQVEDGPQDPGVQLQAGRRGLDGRVQAIVL